MAREILYVAKVKVFVYSLPFSLKNKTFKYIDLLEEYGYLLSPPVSKKIGNNLYELRIRGKNQIRILYCFNKDAVILLHAFRKKTQKIPYKDIQTALDRRNNLI